MSYLYKPPDGYCLSRAKRWNDAAWIYRILLVAASFLLAVSLILAVHGDAHMWWLVALNAATSVTTFLGAGRSEIRARAWLLMALAETDEQIKEANKLLFGDDFITKGERTMTKAKEQPKTETGKRHPVKPSGVREGDIMVFPYWGKVLTVAGERLTVKGLDKGLGEFQVQGAALIELAGSADQVHETVKVSMTEAAERLINSFHRPITVCFEKQDGSERVMRCRLIDHEALLGRSRVEDLEQPEGERFRLVDHRTLRWLIVDGIKYEVGRK